MKEKMEYLGLDIAQRSIHLQPHPQINDGPMNDSESAQRLRSFLLYRHKVAPGGPYKAHPDAYFHAPWVGATQRGQTDSFCGTSREPWQGHTAVWARGCTGCPLLLTTGVGQRCLDGEEPAWSTGASHSYRVILVMTDASRTHQ